MDAACLAFDAATNRAWETYEREVLQAQYRHLPEAEADIEIAKDKRDQALAAARTARGRVLAHLSPR